ncbi:hypothetical protein QP974_13910, partial [Corynebacterium striatum]|nr:hypothetical protein [Corynebacterium striatum]
EAKLAPVQKLRGLPVQKAGRLRVHKVPRLRVHKVAGLQVQKPHGHNTISPKAPDHRLDLVCRNFRAQAPGRLWVADI